MARPPNSLHGVFITTGAATNTRVYWLVAGKQAGKRIPIRKTDATGSGARSFDYTVERRERSVYFAALHNGEAENFFGQVIAAQPLEQTLNVSRLDKESVRAVTLEVALQGVTKLADNPDHSVEVKLNGQALGRLLFDGQEHTVSRFTLLASQLNEGDNRVTLAATGGPSDISLVDYLRLTYPRAYRAEADRLRCSASITEGPAQTINGFSSANARVVDITDPSAVEEIAGRVSAQKDGTFSLSAGVSGQAREWLAFTDAQVRRPAAITLDRPSALKQPQAGASFVIITRREMMTALAQLRQQQGLSVTVADIEDIYDEFSFGEKAPTAVRDFLAYTQLSWKQKPAFVLLAGSGSFDPKNYLGYGDSDLLPAKLVDTSYLETASDDWYVDFNNDGVADIAVGRLPVRTADEAALVVSKLIAYERAAPSTEAVLVADINDIFNFEEASAAVAPLLGGLKITPINRGTLDNEQARKLLLAALSRGPKLVN
jgi:hypothetical protein